MINILCIFFLISFYKELIKNLNIFQQTSYKALKYLKHIVPKNLILKIIILILSIYNIYNSNIILFFILIFFLIIDILIKKEYIIKLKFTKKITRMIITSIIFLIPSVFININLLSIYIILNKIVVLLIYFVNLPLELLIDKYYFVKAKKKLNKSRPLIIGITGSSGKTSTKNILYDLLKEKYDVYKSPKSYNTLKGIVKDINSIVLMPDIYIVEMGATKRYDIDKLNLFLNVDIAIITNITNCHLDSFKSLDNIIKTKLEILNSKNIKKLYFNSDTLDLNIFDYKHIDISSVGFIKNKNNITPTKVLESNNTLTFSLFDKEFTTNLLGMHNIINIMLSLLVSIDLGISLDDLVKYVKGLSFIKNRLELKKYKRFQILDDSYNSNFIGFINALDTLNKQETYKILITPGLQEQDQALNEYYKTLSRKIKEVCDYVFLVNNKSIKILEEYLIKLNCKYTLVNSLKEAFIYISNMRINKYYTILIENDITDIYTLRRIK